MSRFNLDSVIEDLDTTQIERQIPALEQSVEIVNSIAVKAVDALVKGPNRFLVAERLSRLGSIVIPHLEELIRESDELEIKILAAIVLLQFDSMLGVPCLLDAIAHDQDYGGLAAEHLAKKAVKEAIEPIIDRLYTIALHPESLHKQVDLTVNLINALRKLDGDMPSTLCQHLTDSIIPWQIRTLLEQEICTANSIARLAILSYERESIIEDLKVRFQQVPTELVEQIKVIDDVLVLKQLHHQAILVDSIEVFSQALTASK